MNPPNPPNPPNSANPSGPPAPSQESGRAGYGDYEVQQRGAGEKDDGLRRLLTWTFIALGVTLILAAIGVSLAVYWFDSAHP